MHEIRAFLTQDAVSRMLVPKKERAPDSSKGDGLAGVIIPRVESRRTNQRRQDRHLNIVDTAMLYFRRKRIEVEVANVSDGGVMISTGIEPRIGERVHISFEGCNRTQCTVRWVKGTKVGLEFAEETVIIASRDVRELIVSGRRAGEHPPIYPEIDARPPRDGMIWLGLMHHGHGSEEIRFRNISAKGAMLDCGEEVPIGLPVVLEFADTPDIAILGTVRWCRAGKAGICFAAPFDMRLLAEVGAAAPDKDYSFG